MSPCPIQYTKRSPSPKIHENWTFGGDHLTKASKSFILMNFFGGAGVVHQCLQKLHCHDLSRWFRDSKLRKTNTMNRQRIQWVEELKNIPPIMKIFIQWLFHIGPQQNLSIEIACSLLLQRKFKPQLFVPLLILPKIMLGPYITSIAPYYC